MNAKDKQTNNRPEPNERGIFYDFQRLADRSTDAIYHYAVSERQYLFFNRRFVELFELGRTDNRAIPVEPILNQIHPEDRDNLLNAMESVLASGTDRGEMHYRLIQPDGDIKWLYDRWMVLREGGSIVIEGLIRDITGEKLAVDECIDSKQNAPIGAFIVQDNKFKYVNAEFIRITGYTQEVLLNSDPFTYIHEDYRAYVRQQAGPYRRGPGCHQTNG